MHEILDQMFLCGLSEPLTKSMFDLSANIHPLHETIQGIIL